MSESFGYVTIRVRDSSGVSTSVNILLTGTIGEVKKKISESLHLHESFDILLGYPPSICKLPDDAPAMGSITPNDCIRIQRHELLAAPGSSKACAKPTKKTKGPSIASRSSAICTNFRGSTSTASGSHRAVAFGARKMTLSGAVTSQSSTFGQKKRLAQILTNSTSTVKKQRRSSGKSIAATGDGEEDICGALMSAADGGAGGRNKALRSVFRKAVVHQYNDSLAVARLRAAFAGRFSFSINLDIRVLGSGASTKMDVSFPLRPENARSSVHVETVDFLSVELLRAILLSALEDDDGAGAAREFLKPVNMSKASPRIFWSLIKAFGPDISSAMSQLFPQVRTNDVIPPILSRLSVLPLFHLIL